MNRLTRPPTLTSAVADAIREAILRGDMLPGEALKETEISRSLNTSRGTVREALRYLQQTGLVEVFPYRGAFVTLLTPKRIREIYTLRALLEPYALRIALEANPFSEEEIQQLRVMIKKLGELEEKGDDFYEIVTTDVNFHRVLSERCNHELLLDELNNLQELTLLFILTTKIYQSDLERDEITHQMVLEGILSGRPELAEEKLRKHIIDAGTALLKRITEEAKQ